MSDLTKLSVDELLQEIHDSLHDDGTETTCRKCIKLTAEIRRRLEAAENPPQESECAAKLTVEDKQELKLLAKRIYAEATNAANSPAVAFSMICFHLAKYALAQPCRSAMTRDNLWICMVCGTCVMGPLTDDHYCKCDVYVAEWMRLADALMAASKGEK